MEATRWKYLKWSAVALATGVYAHDCYHVYRVLRDHDLQLSKIAGNDDELAKCYAEGAEDVSDERYESEVEELRRELAVRGTKLGLAPDDLVGSYKVARESVVFLAGGRAALLQLAHPYVAAGVAQHSKLQIVGAQQRFYNTFKHMFALTYEDLDKVMSSSRQVRQLHRRVKGTIGEDIGNYTKDSTYTAHNLHALFWVHATLVEGSVFMYEMFIRRLSTEEKDEYVNGSKLIGQTFGIPRDYLPDTWEEFMQRFGGMLNSNYLAVGKDAKEINSFLWRPPSARFTLLIESVKWSTAVKLPRRFAEAFFGRRITSIDVFVWCLLHGLVRFVYRLLPWSVRWLTPYLRLQNRVGIEHTWPHTMLMKFSAAFANRTISELLPPPKKKEAA